ncbi:hypothetical protein ACP70R_040933 [Stipagrostis hirtigluma subsp. patula]
MDASPPQPPPSETTVDSLPTEVLEKVVSHLPLRDAVRTSAVARAWRRLWESAPDLALEWKYGAAPAAVDAVLARYARPVRSFRFRFGLSIASFWRADGWVALLAGKGVEAINLDFHELRGTVPHAMDASMFSCRELTCLDLTGCDIPAAPLGLAGFPKLKKLYLRCVGFPETGARGLEALIAASPLLEVLWLTDLSLPVDDDDGDELEEWVIQGPNLRSLSLCSEYDMDYGWQIGELPAIEDVEIRFGFYSIDRDFVEFLTALAPVRKLNLDLPLRESNALAGLSCSFENLKSLALRTDFCALSNILFTICLLKKAPCLEELSFEIWHDNLQEDEVGIDILSAHWTDGFLGNLKSVSMDLATCQPNEMHFIEFVLSKARQLQEFHICVYEYCSESDEELFVEILKYRRASPQAEVFIN